MKPLLGLIVAALLVAAIGLTGCATSSEASNFGTMRESAHQAALFLSMHGGKITCSGTAIGPHAVLTAKHCFDDYDAVTIAGLPVVVKQVLDDKNDHVILIVDRQFVHFASLAPPGTQLEQMARVYIFGNPSGYVDLYREGYVAGSVSTDHGTATVYDLNGFYGDSGSAIFDMQGRVVGVVTNMEAQFDRFAELKFMLSRPLHFDRADLQLAASA